MKISISKGAIQNAIKAVSKYTGNAAPYLACVHIEAEAEHVTLAATNLDESARCRIPAIVEGEGKCLVSAKRLGEVVSTLPDAAITITVNGAAAEIACGRSRFDIPALDPDDFPGVLSAKADSSVTIPLSTWSMMVSKTAPFAAKNNAKQEVLKGILVEVADGTIRMVATDSYRLMCFDYPAEGEFRAVIPAAFANGSASAPTDASEVTVSVSESVIQVEAGEYTFATRAIAGNYPNYKMLMPDKFNATAVISDHALASALKRASVVGGSVAVEIDIDGDTAKFTASEKEIGSMSDEVACESDGEILIKVNPALALDIVQAMGGFDITLGFISNLKPLSFKSGNQFAIVMPVR